MYLPTMAFIGARKYIVLYICKGVVIYSAHVLCAFQPTLLHVSVHLPPDNPALSQFFDLEFLTGMLVPTGRWNKFG